LADRSRNSITRLPDHSITRFPALNAIVDAEASARAGWDVVRLAAAFLAGGATFLQLRAKGLSGDRFLAAASAIAAQARARGAALVINDRADIARLAHADGVHVGQDDLSPREIRSIVGGDAVVGLSTHTVEQIERAVLEPVTYVAIGPVFGSATKDTGYAAIGLDLVRDAARRAHARGLPLVAIGGITLNRVRDVLDAGADSVAVIGDLLLGGEPQRRVAEYIGIIAAYHDDSRGRKGT
jgi:thiamine-phosphate pyrophosphorylase